MLTRGEEFAYPYWNVYTKIQNDIHSRLFIAKQDKTQNNPRVHQEGTDILYLHDVIKPS